MRIVSMFCGLAALAFAHTAAAAPVTLAPVSFSPEFQVTLDEELGAREGAYLTRAVTHAVNRALDRSGASPGQGSVTIEISIIDADPNRPTMQEMAHTPGLDFGRSYSVGGAELRAVLRGADGQVLREVEHRRYNRSITDFLGPPSTWHEAERAIQQFARKVADAYVEVR
jgi:hypothetical protein